MTTAQSPRGGNAFTSGVRGVRIAGTGRALPVARVTTAGMEGRLNLSSGALSKASGVEARYVCDGESQIDLALTAAAGALANAGMVAGDIDLVLFAAAVPYQPIPATAPLILRGLGIADGRAAGFDVNSTCLSFVTAFEIAARQLAAGAATNALIVSAEVASRALPWETAPEVAALFGDGAGAAVLTRDPAGQIAAMRLRTYPSAYEACGIGAGGTRFDFIREAAAFAAHSRFMMDGKALFRLAAQHFGAFVADLLAEAGWQPADVDLVIPHQASPAALAHMIRQTGFPPDRVVNIVAGHGNQIAASIPFTLDVARQAGRVRPGTRVLILGTSAGVSFGGIALVA